MTHDQSGHFAAKHPPGTTPPAELIEALRRRARDGGLACADAHEVAAALHISPATVGQAADMLELRLQRCQLGLFGYGPKSKRVVPAADVPSPLSAALQQAASAGRLACSDAWRMADRFGLRRLELAGACEKLNIKIVHCQLGAFP